jgi:hypothetical protein
MDLLVICVDRELHGHELRFIVAAFALVDCFYAGAAAYVYGCSVAGAS